MKHESKNDLVKYIPAECNITVGCRCYHCCKILNDMAFYESHLSDYNTDVYRYYCVPCFRKLAYESIMLSEGDVQEDTLAKRGGE